MGRRLTSVSTATSRSLIWITDLNVKDCKSSAQEEKKKEREYFCNLGIGKDFSSRISKAIKNEL